MYAKPLGTKIYLTQINSLNDFSRDVRRNETQIKKVADKNSTTFGLRYARID